MLRGRLVFASPMVEDAVVNSQSVPRVHRGALSSAKRTVVVKDAYLRGVRKGRKGVRLSAKGTVVENGVCSMVVGYAQKACMEVRISVWAMVEERGVLFLDVPKVPVGGPIVA